MTVEGAALALSQGSISSSALTQQCLARIDELDRRFRAVLHVDPRAPEVALVADKRTSRKQRRGPLDGVPLLIKDNIDAAQLATTAGSWALIDNVAASDSFLVRRLREAGAVLLGKTNLSEWANIRSRHSTSGWSAVGGLTRNAVAPERSAGGSSSGSAVAVAAGFAPGAIGTETDGSIVLPAALNGIVGLKPTVGLISRTGVIPISHCQDTPGPMARSVTDVALLLTILAGSDPCDPATVFADRKKADYRAGLDVSALNGVRLGAARGVSRFSQATLAVFERALDRLRRRGAIIVDIEDLDAASVQSMIFPVLLTEFKAGLNAYLAKAHPGVSARTLADVIAFNQQEPSELAWFGQDLLEAAQMTTGIDDPRYIEARGLAHRLAGQNGINRVLEENDLCALVAPTSDPAWEIDLSIGDGPRASASSLPAVAGYPHLTVPMGQLDRLPVGLSFIGAAWSEQVLLSLGYAFETGTESI